MSRIVSKMQLSDQELQDFHLAFQLFDINHDGTITTSELGTALRNLGQNPTEAELQQVILELDKDKNGTIEFDELMELITKNMNRIDPQNECREIFELFDRRQSGFISLDDLRHVVKSSGLQLSEDELIQMIEEADTDGDDKITFDEFSMIVVLKS